MKVVREQVYLGKKLIVGVRPEDFHDEPVFIEASPNTIVIKVFVFRLLSKSLKRKQSLIILVWTLRYIAL
ncbi:hypothetical protein [Bacillus sp. mrc49]|uniref:hypothetical protein n=1 Tax=Bacillus sp. mrc49 TaxID=2054913 RepID=UPI000C26EB5F|nr:hypothetical protein [Bacillus sp. mrc49]PJN88932.1 hypothetical protein CVN76_18460 [Bacillus sp. mrc49]